LGFLANQNSVGRPRAEEWRYTVEKLKGRFVNWDAESKRLRDKYLYMGVGDNIPPPLADK
jgi:hypothetical protein